MLALVRKLGIDLLQTTLLLGIYPRDSASQYRGTCSFMFIAGLFTIAINWKQAGCPLTDE